MQAFKFELRPNGAQIAAMRRFAGCRRFVYNQALALQQGRYESGESHLRYVELAKELTGWRNGDETPWLKDAPVHPLQHALKDLERAYVNFFEGRARFPRFKKRGCGDSFRYPDPKQFAIDETTGRIKLPKLGWIRYRKSRSIAGTPKQITVSEAGGRCYVSIQTERVGEAPVHPETSMIGIDVGITRFATLSDGSFIESLKILDQGWGNFRRMLDYKLTWLGGELLAVPAAYTSRTCAACGHEAAENRPSQACFQCVSCGHEAHADLNAARNILAAGHAAIACGAEALVAAMKQEPVEATTTPALACG